MKVYESYHSVKYKENDICIVSEGIQIKELFRKKFKLEHLSTKELIERITEMINEKQGFDYNPYMPSTVKHYLDSSEITSKEFKEALERLFKFEIYTLKNQVLDFLTHFKDNIHIYDCEEDVRIFKKLIRTFEYYRVPKKYTLIAKLYLQQFRFGLKHYIEAIDDTILLADEIKEIDKTFYVIIVTELIYMHKTYKDKKYIECIRNKVISIKKKTLESIDKHIAFDFLNEKGLFYKQLGENTKALYVFKYAQNFANELEMIKVKNNMAIAIKNQGKYKKAIKIYDNILASIKKSDVDRIMIILNNKLHASIEMNNFRIAKNTVTQSINLLKTKNINTSLKIIFCDTYIDYLIKFNQDIDIMFFLDVIKKSNKMLHEREYLYSLINKLYLNNKKLILSTIEKLIKNEVNVKEKELLIKKYSIILLDLNECLLEVI